MVGSGSGGRGVGGAEQSGLGRRSGGRTEAYSDTDSDADSYDEHFEKKCKELQKEINDIGSVRTNQPNVPTFCSCHETLVVYAPPP